ncbi:hypothetical protein ACLKA7_001957, partial [Drosophila subpalustris]
MKLYSRRPCSGAICNEAFPAEVGVSVRPGATQEDGERTRAARCVTFILPPEPQVQIRAQARPVPATLEDAPGDEKRIRPKSQGQVRPAGTSMRPPPRARRPRCGPKSDPGRTKRKLPMPVA